MKTVSNLLVLIPLLCLPLLILAAQQAAQPTFNYATILQDTRNEPKVDGTFGFLYRTEDGISHGAKGDADGAVHGRFTYTDPTGLKVNFNYNAGSRAVHGYPEDRPSEAAPRQPAYKQINKPIYRQPEPTQYEPEPQYDAYDYQDEQVNQVQQPHAASYSTELQYGGVQQQRAQPRYQHAQAQPRFDDFGEFGHSQDYTHAYFSRTKPPALRSREEQPYYQNNNNY